MLHDPEENQESKTAKGKMATSYSYDETTLQLKKSTATDGVEVTYEYNPEGQLAKVTDATGTREFEYDLRGQVVKESVTLQPDPDSPPIRYEIRRTYTALGQPESVHLVSAEGEALPLDHKVDYAWNAYGQLASVKSLAGEFEYEYDAKNPALLAKMTGPAHIVETTYEPHRNLITGVTNFAMRGGAGSTLPAGTAAVLSSYTYSNDVLGRRETISQGGEAFALLKLGDTNVDVAYNDRGEVIGAVYKGQSGSGIPPLEFSYEYDGIGNRKEARSTRNGEQSLVSYTANALNQYTAIQTTTAAAAGSGPRTKDNGPRIPSSYDLDGNLIEDDKNRYTWDFENRLVRVESKSGDLRIDYRHDYQGRRTVRLAYSRTGGTENWQLKTENFYLYDGWNLLAEVESVPAGESGSDFGLRVSSLLTWGRDLSGSLQGAGGVGGLLAISESESHRFPAYDANGNVSQLVDESGAITAAYTYDPFGNVTEMAGPEAEENPWRFSTKPVDAGTGWLYYGFRYYQPETGRWPSRDPIEEDGGINLYGFAGNFAIGESDALGLSYSTWQEAAKSACSQYFDLAAKNQTEYGGNILQCKVDGQLTYEFTVATGGEYHMPTEAFEFDEAKEGCPCKVRAWWHVHPKDPNLEGGRTEIGNFFSPTDTHTAENTHPNRPNPWGRKMLAVLCNPIGETRYYDPYTMQPWGGNFNGFHPGIPL